MSNEELMEVKGGSLSATMVSAIINGLKGLYNLGKSIGSAIRRVLGGKYCPID